MERDRAIGNLADLDGHQSEIIDMAQAIQQIDRNSSLAEVERRELMQIEKALAKLAIGTFGYIKVDVFGKLVSYQLFKCRPFSYYIIRPT